jgi:phosphotransferase system enzyme I (PtsP)
MTRARHLLQAALRCEDGNSVRRLMSEELENLGLGGLLRPGK